MTYKLTSRRRGEASLRLRGADHGEEEDLLLVLQPGEELYLDRLPWAIQKDPIRRFEWKKLQKKPPDVKVVAVPAAFTRARIEIRAGKLSGKGAARK